MSILEGQMELLKNFSEDLLKNKRGRQHDYFGTPTVKQLIIQSI